mgnify:CR=1 FL=1
MSLLDKVDQLPQPPKGISPLYKKNFGVGYHSGMKAWAVYNVLSNNCIATIKYLKKEKIVRYRANSVYAEILKDRSPIKASADLKHMASWCIEHLREGTEKSYGKRVKKIVEKETIDDYGVIPDYYGAPLIRRRNPRMHYQLVQDMLAAQSRYENTQRPSPAVVADVDVALDFLNNTLGPDITVSASYISQEDVGILLTVGNTVDGTTVRITPEMLNSWRENALNIVRDLHAILPTEQRQIIQLNTVVDVLSHLAAFSGIHVIIRRTDGRHTGSDASD